MGVTLALAGTVVFRASTFAGIRAGLGEYGPGEIALFRFVVASVVLGCIALVTRMRLPERRDLPAVFLAGFLAFTVYHVALNYGEVAVGAGAASVLINTAPLFTALLAVTFLGERLRVLGWVGMAVSFFGAVLISAGEGEGFGLAPQALLILLAALSSSIYFVIQKPYLQKYGARLHYLRCLGRYPPLARLSAGPHLPNGSGPASDPACYGLPRGLPDCDSLRDLRLRVLAHARFTRC